MNKYATIASLIFASVVGLYFLISFMAAKVKGQESTDNTPKGMSQEEVRRLAVEFKLVAYEKTSRVVNSLSGVRSYTETVKHFPKIHLTDDGLIIQLHSSLQGRKLISENLQALATRLFIRGAIKTQNLSVNNIGVNKFHLKAISHDEKRLLSLLSEAGLSSKDPLTGTIEYPGVSIDEAQQITLDCNLVALSKNQVVSAIPYFNTLNSNFSYNERDVTFMDSIYILKATAKPQMMLKENQTVLDNLSNVQEVINSAKSTWVFGQDVEDGTLLSVKYLERAHMLIVGSSGSGKTQLLKSILYSRLLENPQTEILVYDGKASQDLVLISELASPFKSVANSENVSNPTVEISNLVEYVFTKYVKRKVMLEEMKASNFEEYNLKKPSSKIHPIILVLEEAPVLFGNFMNYEKEMDVLNTLSNRIKRLMNESRSVGINIIYCSQGATNEFIPSQISKNILTIAGKASQQTASYLDMPELVSLNKSFGFKDEGRRKFFKSFYLGSDAQVETLFRNLNIKQKTKIDFNPNLIAFKGNETARGEVLNLIKAFLYNGDVNWESSSPNSDEYLLSVGKGSASVDFVFANKDELFPEILNKVYLQTISNRIILVIDFEIATNFFIKTRDDLQSKLNKPTLVFSLSMIRKWVGKSRAANSNEAFLKDIEEEFVALTSSSLTEEGEGSSEVSTTDYSQEEAEAEISALTVKELDRVMNLKAKSAVSKAKKGRQFEAITAMMLKAKNPELSVYIGAEAKKRFSKDYFGDGSCDILIEYPDKSISIIQCKNISSNQINVDVVRALATSKSIAESRGLIVKDLILAHTSELTDDAAKMIDELKIKVMDKRSLRFDMMKIEEGSKKKPGRPKKGVS